MICRKCAAEVDQNFCPNCGTPAKLERINSKFIFKEFSQLFNQDSGLLYTIRELSIRPGKAIKIYITTDRTKLQKPIIFLFFCSLIYTIISQNTTLSNYFILEDNQFEVVKKALNWLEQNYGYMNLVLALISSFWLRLLFRKTKYNYYETLVLYIYAVAYSTLMESILSLSSNILKVEMRSFIHGIGVVYITWTIGQFYNAKSVWSYLKAIISYVLMYGSLIILVVIAILAYALVEGVLL